MNLRLSPLLTVLSLLCFKAIAGTGSVDPSDLGSDLAVFVGLKSQVQGVLREPQASLACLNSEGVGASGVNFEEVVGNDPEGNDDEPEPLLDFLNAWWRKVTSSSSRAIHGLSRRIELELLDLLTS